jgi:LysM repeat protein
VPSLYTVVAGDCLYSIAQQYGFPDWKTIYDDPENKDFKKARPDPNVLYPGDQLVIPDLEPSTKNVSCTLDQEHKFKVKLPHVMLRVKVKDEDDKPITGKKFRLEVGDKNSYDGTTDGDGIVQQRIPVGEKAARLWIFFTGDEENGEHLMWDVGVGFLDPNDTPEGLQKRMNNLGFLCGDPDGQWHPGMDVAIRTFQKSVGISPSGKLDDATTAKLKDTHGKI